MSFHHPAILISFLLFACGGAGCSGKDEKPASSTAAEAKSPLSEAVQQSPRVAISRRAQENDLTIAGFISHLEGLDRERRKGETDNEKYERMGKTIEQEVSSVNSAHWLHDAYYPCLERAARFDPQGQAAHVDPYGLAIVMILQRLGEMKNDEAAKMLVDLLSDESLVWYGEGALNIGNAITMCGKPCLPYLKQVKRSSYEKFVKQLIQYIERGEILRP